MRWTPTRSRTNNDDVVYCAVDGEDYIDELQVIAPQPQHMAQEDAASAWKAIEFPETPERRDERMRAARASWAEANACCCLSTDGEKLYGMSQSPTTSMSCRSASTHACARSRKGNGALSWMIHIVPT